MEGSKEEEELVQEEEALPFHLEESQMQHIMIAILDLAPFMFI